MAWVRGMAIQQPLCWKGQSPASMDWAALYSHSTVLCSSVHNQTAIMCGYKLSAENHTSVHAYSVHVLTSDRLASAPAHCPTSKTVNCMDHYNSNAHNGDHITGADGTSTIRARGIPIIKIVNLTCMGEGTASNLSRARAAWRGAREVNLNTRFQSKIHKLNYTQLEM